jgi:roadblock/LC7 domain-containing protein
VRGLACVGLRAWVCMRGLVYVGSQFCVCVCGSVSVGLCVGVRRVCEDGSCRKLQA